MQNNITANTAGIGVSIVGVGAYVPETIISNDDLCRLVDTSDEWIATRTGIRQRRIVSGDQSVTEMAVAAAKDALQCVGMEGSEIDLIVVATCTSDMVYPSVACQVQHAIGAVNAAGFDLSLACSGFIFSLVTAYQYLKNGMFKNALVIGSDIHSRLVDWTDRNTCVLFGDGAGAVVLKAAPGVDDILVTDLRMDGSKAMELTLYTNAQNCPLVEPRSERPSYIWMNGREMFKFAVGIVPESIKSVLASVNLNFDDIDYVVLHQANIRIMQAMSERLGLSMEKIIVNMERYGNTSSASIPIALNDASLSGKIKKGDLLVLCGFGAGAAWGTSIVRWVCVDKRRPQEAEASTKQPHEEGGDEQTHASHRPDKKNPNEMTQPLKV